MLEPVWHNPHHIDCGSGSFSHEMSPPSTLFPCRFIFTCNTVTSIKSMSTVYFPPIRLTPHWLNALLHNACDSYRDQAWLHDRQHLNIRHNTPVNFTHTTWTLCHATVLFCPSRLSQEMRHLFHRHCSATEPLVFAEQVNVFWLDRPPHRFM